MRFKTFLEDVERSPEECARLIYEHCQPFLRQSNFEWPNGDHMFRGIQHEIGGPFGQVTNRERAPRDSTKAVHTLLDNHFADKFGIRFRSKGFFCTGAMGIASDYGTVHMVFPIGKFDYLWSPTVEDAYNEFDGYKDGMDPLVLKTHPHLFSMKHIWMMEDEKEAFSAYKVELKAALEKNGLGYRLNEGLAEAISADVEIMISCPSYYAVYWEIPARWSKTLGMPARDIMVALGRLVSGNK